MRTDKKYYIVMSIVMFINFFVISIISLHFITGFLTSLVVYKIFNIAWNFYHNKQLI